jgi:hypothetical protein
MGLLDALLGRTSPQDEDARRPASVTVVVNDVTIETDWQDWKATSKGDMEVRGWQPIDPETGAWMYGDDVSAKVRKAGVLVCPVAGISNYSARVVADFAPGEPVELRPEPSNKYDRNAVAVRDGDNGRLHVGYLPREVAAEVAKAHATGSPPYAGVVIWEFRKPGARSRDAMRLLIGPGLTVKRR